MIKDIARRIAEDAEGAEGCFTPQEIVARAASDLVDYLHDGLVDNPHDIDEPAKRAIERLIAWAMFVQWQHDDEGWRAVLALDSNCGSPHPQPKSPFRIIRGGRS